jgi:hypothetical protein
MENKKQIVLSGLRLLLAETNNKVIKMNSILYILE